ncbi:MAG: nucleotidyltransferase domain-containing protein [Candidatus Riflebacteria bacterium]|nr:nucleotidyltransferase domain-containing protein [Candidatus Riflebacteria bacterium]
MNSGEFHLREIERQSVVTIGAVRTEAEHLSQLDLLVKRIDGNRTYYRANSNHPLFNNLRELVIKTVGAGDVLKAAFVGNKVDFIFIFGSTVTGNQKSQSDVDLFVIGDIGLREASKILKEPVAKIGREINPHIMTLEEFSKRVKEKEHFVTSVLESTILMITGNEDELRNLG